MREGALLLGRFGVAGLVNTAVGFAVIVMLDPGLHAPPALANALGYGAGMGVGFLLNRAFVFRSRTGLAASGGRYAIAALGAFALNQAVLRAAGLILGGGALAHVAAQLAAMAAYTAALFMLCRLWVFPPLPAA
jgi:putative flippase GtrA